jgi:hypothetical protein
VAPTVAATVVRQPLGPVTQFDRAEGSFLPPDQLKMGMTTGFVSDALTNASIAPNSMLARRLHPHLRHPLSIPLAAPAEPRDSSRPPAPAAQRPHELLRT